MQQGPQRALFRVSALENYLRERDRDNLPRFVSWPIPLFIGLLLGILVVASWFAWSVELPVYVSGPGIVLPASNGVIQQQQSPAVAAVFLPPAAAERLAVGLPVDVQFNSSAIQIHSSIVMIEPGIASPTAIQKRFGVAGRSGVPVTQPSLVVLVKLPDLPVTTYAGSVLSARVKVGAQRMIALLPGLGRFAGK
ncbi:MAG: hypothetical protein IMW89_01570 [Ktedonobacteraceae bacterium]|nr:hypothetical protein [Ktedonobacteraceae bacterium]